MCIRDRDLDGYIRHYKSSFKYKRMNLRSYKRYKGRVFNSYKNMDVAVKDLRVFSHEKYAISVMNQDFNGDGRYVSTGRKVLYWKKENGQWKISDEKFGRKHFKAQTYSRELMAKLYKDSPSAKLYSKQSAEPSKL